MNAVVSLILWKMCTENYVLQTYLPSTVNKEQQLKHKKKKLFCHLYTYLVLTHILDLYFFQIFWINLRNFYSLSLLYVTESRNAAI